MNKEINKTETNINIKAKLSNYEISGIVKIALLGGGNSYINMYHIVSSNLDIKLEDLNDGGFESVEILGAIICTEAIYTPEDNSFDPITRIINNKKLGKLNNIDIEIMHEMEF